MLRGLTLLLISVQAMAGTATVSWTNPTTKTDGSTLPSSEITRTEVEYSTSATFSTISGTATATGAATSIVINSLPPQTFYFRAFTVAGGGRSSASNVVSKVVPDSPPNPPTLTTVSTAAYRISVVWGGMLRLVRVREAELPLGAGCTQLPGLTGFGVVGDYIGRCQAG